MPFYAEVDTWLLLAEKKQLLCFTNKSQTKFRVCYGLWSLLAVIVKYNYFVSLTGVRTTSSRLY